MTKELLCRGTGRGGRSRGIGRTRFRTRRGPGRLPLDLTPEQKKDRIRRQNEESRKRCFDRAVKQEVAVMINRQNNEVLINTMNCTMSVAKSIHATVATNSNQEAAMIGNEAAVMINRQNNEVLINTMNCTMSVAKSIHATVASKLNQEAAMFGNDGEAEVLHPVLHNPNLENRESEIQQASPDLDDEFRDEAVCAKRQRLSGGYTKCGNYDDALAQYEDILHKYLDLETVGYRLVDSPRERLQEILNTSRAELKKEKLKRLEEVKALKEQLHLSKNEKQKVEESNRNLITTLMGSQSTIADQQSMIMKLQEENSMLRNQLG